MTIAVDCDVKPQNKPHNSVPIHVELRLIHSDIVKITHTFQDKNVHSRTFFFLSKCIEK